MEKCYFCNNKFNLYSEFLTPVYYEGVVIYVCRNHDPYTGEEPYKEGIYTIIGRQPSGKDKNKSFVMNCLTGALVYQYVKSDSWVDLTKDRIPYYERDLENLCFNEDTRYYKTKNTEEQLKVKQEYILVTLNGLQETLYKVEENLTGIRKRQKDRDVVYDLLAIKVSLNKLNIVNLKNENKLNPILLIGCFIVFLITLGKYLWED